MRAIFCESMPQDIATAEFLTVYFYVLLQRADRFYRGKGQDSGQFRFAGTRKIEGRGTCTSGTIPIQLAVGLPPAHYGAQYQKFEQ